MISEIEKEGEEMGLKVNVNKTKFMKMGKRVEGKIVKIGNNT